MEANVERRKEYLEEIREISSKDLVYIDESGIELSAIKDRGWGRKGKILHSKKSGKYYERTNIIAGLVENKAIAPMVFKGSCNTEILDKWVEDFLIKELKAEQVVIMDNAAFHKSQKAKELIESVGCTVIFLPPYSPNLNPIEKFGANMKRWIKDRIVYSDQLHNIIDAFFSLY